MRHEKKSLFKRSERVGDQIARELASSFIKEVADPRVQRCTITSVEVSDDMRHAKVYFSLLEDHKEDIAQSRAALQKAEGFFKRILASRLRLRFTPSLRFYHDASLEHGAKMLSLIKEVNKTDDQDNSSD